MQSMSLDTHSFLAPTFTTVKCAYLVDDVSYTYLIDYLEGNNSASGLPKSFDLVIHNCTHFNKPFFSFWFYFQAITRSLKQLTQFYKVPSQFYSFSTTEVC